MPDDGNSARWGHRAYSVLTYPRDLAGRWTGVFDIRPSQNWTGWDMVTSEQAGVPIQACCGYEYLLHPDLLGSTRMTTDQNGAVQRDQLFYPWGQKWQQAGGWTWIRFAGLDFPGIAGSDAAQFRNYMQSYGRWMTPDKLGGDVADPQSLNRYAYVMNNPATFSDPLGLSHATACWTYGPGWEDLPGCETMSGGGGGGSNPADLCSDPSFAISHAQCGSPIGLPTSPFPPLGGIGGEGGGIIFGGASSSGQPPMIGGGMGGWPNAASSADRRLRGLRVFFCAGGHACRIPRWDDARDQKTRTTKAVVRDTRSSLRSGF
jgi:RHS repeat-associated protein